MVLGLSHSLEIFSESGIQLVGNELTVISVPWVLLSVEEPLGDVVVSGSGDDVADGVDLSGGDLAGPLVGVDLSDLEGVDGEPSTHTLDLSEPERSLLLSVDVCVLHSQNVSELVRVLQYQ